MPNNIPQWNEFKEVLKFSRTGQIKIPKRVREESFSLAIDLEIVAISRQQYLDFTSYPANGYYGKAVLVMRDYTEVHVDITQARQRLHYFYSDSAVVGWYNFVQTDQMLRGLKATQELICPLYSLINAACVPSPCPDVPLPPWIEAELREVYVECPFGTTFRIEISNRVFEQYSNVCGDIVTPKSSQEDNPKDNGLPENGYQPQVATNKVDPYTGFDIPSSTTELGDYLLQKNNLDSPNPSNGIRQKGNKLFFGSSWIERYDNGVPVLGSELGRKYPLAITDCIVETLSSRFKATTQTSRGSVNQIEFLKNGVVFAQGDFIGTTADFSIVECLI